MSEQQWNKLKSIGIGALIAAIGALLAFALDQASQAYGAGELGPYGYAVVMLLSVLTNAFRKYVLEKPAQQTLPPDDPNSGVAVQGSPPDDGDDRDHFIPFGNLG